MAVWRRAGPGGPGRYDLWTRASLYALLAAVPLLALVLAAGQRQARVPGLVAFMLLSAAQAGVCVALLRASLSRYLAAGPRPNRWLVASAVALTVAGVAAGAAAFPAFTQPSAGAFPVSVLVVMLFGGALTVALTPLLSLPALLAVVLAGAAAASGMAASTGGAGAGGHALVGAFLVYAFVIGGVAALTGRASAWGLRVMWELDRSRTAHARLAVAEERLRFARDLHDVLGRNLSLIAVTSELAAQLARRSEQEAAEHMLEVHRVAHESLREMREVVSGYRTADLDSELAGARAVLRSAGVSCRVLGDAAGLSPEVQAALGWVVREGTTNIIRHSDAAACTIDLRVLDSPGTTGTVRLRMDNDGVRPAGGGAHGSGLLGLAERLARVGGTITARSPRSGHFRLEATLPASGTVAAPPAPGQAGTGGTPAEPAP